MKKRLATAAVLLGFSVSALAQTVVTVNGTKIDSKIVDSQVALSKMPDTPQLRDQITQRLITRTLLLQEAQRLKLDQDPQYLDLLKQARAEAKRLGDDKKAGFNEDWATFKDNLLADAVVSDAVSSKPIAEDEIKQSYQNLQKYYQGSQEVQLGEVVTRSADDAQAVISGLKANKKFADLVKQYTIDPTGKEAGGIPKSYVPLKDLQEGAPQVYEAVKDLKKGQYTTAPLQGNNVYVVFYVNDKRNVTLPPLAEMTPVITERLQAARANAVIDALYKKANIK
ncbi:peptidyl-prolyl cis-trans isomerase [Stenoxybacter acetivorans]|uniref:peptidyl-prolyl cis-trans isomerase n=1 Tax=Stenoxybacter acetivorans TaxID=422441 RepID=UPI0005680119|nr:peptidyl-prolyl cis-trans isomerase [Stenoxybacter acetivorans]